MTRKFSITIDCSDPDRLAHFWAEALGYQIEPPPPPYDSWKSYWRSVGLSEEELEEVGEGSDSLVDPEGMAPRIWFQKVPEDKAVKNRVHLDLHVSSGRSVPLAIRKQQVDAAADRLISLGATRVRVLEEPGVDHYAVAMQDPEGNEFDLN